jgi:hypothetical protein
VHTDGKGVKALLEQGIGRIDEGTVEEVLRFDPPLHPVHALGLRGLWSFGPPVPQGDQVGLLLGAANRDSQAYPSPRASTRAGEAGERGLRGRQSTSAWARRSRGWSC